MAKETQDLGTKEIAELLAEITSMENDYQQMKFDHAVKGLANPMEIRDLRRNIARLHTEVRRREMAEMTPDQLALRSKIRARRRRQR
ncbi:MAG: 50S ribosomal protein L29 [Saprospiraceae bacterium]|nr:50S ribosomal protein L29 [Saprospiraceae bacterium]